MLDEGIIRARAKIEATVGNARSYLRMMDAGEDFSTFIWGHVGGSPLMGDGANVPAQTEISRALSKSLKDSGFKFVGGVTAYAFMQAAGLVNDHALDCGRRAACAAVSLS